MGHGFPSPWLSLILPRALPGALKESSLLRCPRNWAALALLNACSEHGHIRKMKQRLLKEAWMLTSTSGVATEHGKQGTVPDDAGRSWFPSARCVQYSSVTCTWYSSHASCCSESIQMVQQVLSVSIRKFHNLFGFNQT